MSCCTNARTDTDQRPRTRDAPGQQTTDGLRYVRRRHFLRLGRTPVRPAGTRIRLPFDDLRKQPRARIADHPHQRVDLRP
ncbi:hypothetical protein D3C87_1895570 [compost metagenome]